MAETKKETLERLYRIIDTDATAIAFQTLGQYRVFLRDTVRGMIKSCDSNTIESEQSKESLPDVNNQRELLLAFLKDSENFDYVEIHKSNFAKAVEDYLVNNCV